MNKIHFDHIGGNRKWAFLNAISLIFILTGFFELIAFSTAVVNQWLIITGFFIPVVFLSKLFWHKNVVQWNKKGVVIRVKQYLGKSLRFNDIESTHLGDQKLTITTKSGKQLYFDLHEFPESDSIKLKNILTNRIKN